MKKVALTVILSVLSIYASNAQHWVQEGGGQSLRRVEHNYRNNHTIVSPGGRTDGQYNLDSKSEDEKLLFGESNAEMEFFIKPSLGGSSGFRIVRDSLAASYMLEVKYISNYDEVMKELGTKYPLATIPVELLFSIPDNISNLIAKHNNAVSDKIREEAPTLYQIRTLSCPISDKFAEKLYKKTVDAIDRFKAKGKPEGIFDGYRVTFRCVVEDEVWSLNIHCPQGDYLAFSDLFRLIITDAQEGKFDEAKYLKSLKD